LVVALSRLVLALQRNALQRDTAWMVGGQWSDGTETVRYPLPPISARSIRTFISDLINLDRPNLPLDTVSATDNAAPVSGWC
jgi:hypothetical protein